jgi:hypothetical protein
MKSEAVLTQPIRFLRLSRYGAVGETTTKFDYGLRATLVECGVAEWVAEDSPGSVSVRKSKKEITHAS